MPNHLQKIAAFSPEAEKTTAHGVVLEHLLHAESQARKAAPHVGVASRQPRPWGSESSSIQSLDDSAKRLNVDPRIDNDAPPARQLDLNSLLGRKCRRAPR